ncbi:hypothetical protein HDV06_003921 [Boothiomyces sp. JEL0866]|nr:hypothetical protein HDV06_003921 [Boothiomyces sp. JEL0866]
MEYRNKQILAPMVRVGTLPMRLLALKYGAELLGTIDYIDDSGNGGLVLRIHPKEQPKLVLQIGSSNPELAVQAALKLQNDVSAVDLNCGCPKKFSLHSGMGANLLRTPDKLCAILEALVANLSIPVTCKIRLLDPTADQTTEERTIELLKKIEKTNVKAIGVHCRFTHERPRQPGHWEVFEKLAPAISIPLIANGDLYSQEDVRKLKSSFGKDISSFMFARAAQWNVSMFRRSGVLPIKQVILEYLKTAIEFDMPYHNVKYTILQMQFPKDERIETEQKIIACRTLEQICSEYFEITDFYKETVSAREAKLMEIIENQH